ncbi:MAG: serine phosphatase RsbU regulator of sigma subunit [Comamonadaceae bacterium]|nr:MAG: serine phosphatase RsbU regulator of sigma subunit [Comamonadaceae bacterium]
MTESGSKPPVRVNFFRNYNRVVGAAFLAIVLLTLGFFLQQLNQKHKQELATIQAHVARHSQFIEFILRSSLDYLESLRTTAHAHYDAAGHTATNNHALFSHLREHRDTGRFDLDALPDRDSGGNLTGLGSLSARDPAFYQDVNMALGLNQTFFSIVFNLPSAAEASYMSVENFATLSPWQSSSNRKFDKALYDSPIWQLGQPEHNPNREKYWGPVHFGGKEVGLLVPAGAPVYNKDFFRGIVSIETSLDYLNRINADFGYKPGTVMLVDAQGTVLAHPDLAMSAMEQQTTQSINALLPPEVVAAKLALRELPENQPTEIAGHLLIKHSFVSAPWHLVYVVPTRVLWVKLLTEHGGAMLAMFLGLSSLIIVMYAVTAREFVVPATKLVQHLAAESEFKPLPVPVVPFPWRPWFETISRAFRESLQLMSLRQELNIAANMQQAILPHHWPANAAFQLWGAMRSAKEVGGDFYDHFPLEDGKTGFVVADVSGKGVPAALFGMVSKTLIRATATQSTGEPGMTLATVNDALCVDNDTCMFVTVFYAEFDPANGLLTYVNAGHPPPLLIHADGHSEFAATTDGIALGVAEGEVFAQHQIQLQAGDVLVVYTDGVTEAFNPASEEFTQERLPGLFVGKPEKDVKEAVNRVIRAVDEFAAGAPQSDDITCVALHYCPATPRSDEHAT